MEVCLSGLNQPTKYKLRCHLHSADDMLVCILTKQSPGFFLVKPPKNLNFPHPFPNKITHCMPRTICRDKSVELMRNGNMHTMSS